jgi:hypothetical protein
MSEEFLTITGGVVPVWREREISFTEAERFEKLVVKEYFEEDDDTQRRSRGAGQTA